MVEIVVRANFEGQPNCLICGKPMENHSFEQATACVAVENARIADKHCPSCGRLFSEHSLEQVKTSAHKQREQR
jgi:hypothetical protein